MAASCVRPVTAPNSSALMRRACERLPGVIAVARDGRFLGVVAEREEQAIAARAALMKAATWRVPAGLPDAATVHDYLKTRPDIDTKTVNEKTASAQPAVKTLTATYRKPYLAHASIGPSCGAAGLIDDMLTVWSHTQGPYPLRADIAKATGIALEKVRVIHAQGAGCYGHNGADDAALDAALLSLNANGRLVKVQWMRDDEFGWEPFGSAMTMAASAGLSADGTIVDWQYDVWSCTHNMRPGNRQGVNLLASWHLAKPFEQRNAGRARAARGRRRPQRGAGLRFSQSENRRSFHPGHAAARLGAAHAGRLRQCVRAGILHGRAGGSGGRRSGRVPSETSERRARPRRAASRCGKSGMEAGREKRWHARARRCVFALRDDQDLCRADRRCGGRPDERRGARRARHRGGRCRTDDQSRRPEETRSRAASSRAQAGRSKNR